MEMAYIQAENLKHKRTFTKTLIVLAPFVTALMNFFAPLWFQLNSYNWWYILLYPGFLTLTCALIEQRDNGKLKYRAVASLPVSQNKVWKAKIGVAGIYSCVGNFIFLALNLLGGFAILVINEIPLTIGIYGGMIVSYITMEIWTGIWILVRFLPMALIIFAGVMIIEVGIEFIQKKKIEVKILNWLCQFLWILIVVSILKITGIIGGSFGISSPLDSYISFKLFEDGFNAATILNICLFVPYGFLPVFIFKNIHKHWWNGVILGAVFSIGIEFLQTFIGRFAQLDDVIMNTCGTLVGFLIGCLLLRITTRKK